MYLRSALSVTNLRNSIQYVFCFPKHDLSLFLQKTAIDNFFWKFRWCLRLASKFKFYGWENSLKGKLRVLIVHVIVMEWNASHEAKYPCTLFCQLSFPVALATPAAKTATRVQNSCLALYISHFYKVFHWDHRKNFDLSLENQRISAFLFLRR